MSIHVARQSSQQGVFTAEEVAAGLRSGRFLTSDLGWKEGMTSWVALGEWPEFRGAFVLAAAPSPAGDPFAPPTIPWEQGKSLRSFFATLKGALLTPRETLASGRFEFGDWVLFCYVAVLCAAPFQLLGQLLSRGQTAEFARWMADSGIESFRKIGEQMAKQPEPPVIMVVLSMVLGLAFAPLLYAFCGLVHWLGQKVFRLGVSVERTVSAVLISLSLLIVLGAPLQVFRFSLPAYACLGVLAFVPFCVIYYRALGAATGVSPWKQFGVSVALYAFFCCCCCGFFALLGAVAGGGAAFLQKLS